MDDTDAAPAGQTRTADRMLAIDTALGAGALVMTRLDGEDAISRCFLYRIEVVATAADVAVESLMGEAVTLWIRSDITAARRPIHGHVRAIAGMGRDIHGNRRYEIEVVPRVWFLSCSVDCRIFQDMTVPDILSTVFADQGLSNVAFRVVRENYPRLDYCVQYQESAFDFVCRLMEHLGIFWWHEHTAHAHVLVIGDRNNTAGACDPATVSVSANRRLGEVQTLDFRSVFRPGKWTLNDYDFTSPTRRLLVDTATTLNVPRMLTHEVYHWAGSFSQQDDGRVLSRIRMEMEEARHRVVVGSGHCSGFDPGRRVTIESALNDPAKNYLLTEVRHHATSPGIDAAADPVSPEYTNEFVAIPFTVPYRPPLVTPKPVMRGQQTATVVGPAGQSIFCDPFGRVRVQFHWDRRGQRNERSSCWIRVSQSRAGSFYGSLVIPHVGHEVIVAFLEGDPDRPLITGSVPNALTMPSVELPYDKDKTIQRDHGDNRMVMQGKPGQEHLSLVSPRRINMFSAPRGARSLSAHGLPATWTDKVYQFSGDAIDPYKDPTGLYEVWEGWYLLNNPGTKTNPTTAIPLPPGGLPGFDGNPQDDLGTQSGDILKLSNPAAASSSTVTVTVVTPATSTTPATEVITTPATTAYTWKDSGQGVDMKVEECDINSFTAGRNNAVSLGNKNTWVWTDNNTWVNGNSNGQINGDSNSTINGSSMSEVKSNATSIVHDCAVSLVYLDRTNFTGGASESAVWGLNMSLNMMAAINITLGIFYSYTGTNLSSAALRLSAAEAKIDDCMAKFVSTAARVTTAENDIHTTATTLHDHGIEVHL